MEALIIAPTEVSPEINFNAESGIFKMEGKSFMENTLAFYEKIETWLTEYSESPTEKTILNIYLSYYNSSTFREILSILMKFKQLKESGNKILIKWGYDSKDNLSHKKGTELALLLQLPFEYIEK
ncbi:MAG: DUF1987 domain-containing protein [Bacteroidota bacterium]